MAISYTTVPSTVKDGIFLIYSNGYFRRFDESIKASDKDGVKYIGIIYEHKSFAVALHDLGIYPIIRGGVPTPTFMDFVEHTQIIQNAGANIPLPTGEYLPTCAIMGILQFLSFAELEHPTSHTNGLNSAFDFVGGERIDVFMNGSIEIDKFGNIISFDESGTYWVVDDYYETKGWNCKVGIEHGAYTGYMGLFPFGHVRPIAKFIYNREYLLGSSEPVDTNVILSFSTMAKKEAFCDLLGADVHNGDAVLQLIQ